jgi:uncharacterized protein YjhX (UPF0386 family)
MCTALIEPKTNLVGCIGVRLPLETVDEVVLRSVRCFTRDSHLLLNCEVGGFVGRLDTQKLRGFQVFSITRDESTNDIEHTA